MPTKFRRLNSGAFKAKPTVNRFRSRFLNFQIQYKRVNGSIVGDEQQLLRDGTAAWHKLTADQKNYFSQNPRCRPKEPEFNPPPPPTNPPV